MGGVEGETAAKYVVGGCHAGEFDERTTGGKSSCLSMPGLVASEKGHSEKGEGSPTPHSFGQCCGGFVGGKYHHTTGDRAVFSGGGGV